MDPSPLLAAFRRQFGAAPAFLVRAPGRVNLIGEHTDYNDGFVLPMAIEQAVWIALRPRADREVRLRSLDYPQAAEISLDRLEKGPGSWIEYLKGIAWALLADGRKLDGWEGFIGGDVPRGSGLSSSAAVELACARAFAAVSGLDWNPAAMARLAQKAENQWVGVNCGIMDQMVSAAARRGHALFLDCRSLEYQHIPLPPGLVVVILDTSTRRGLVDSAYNERRAQCEAAARFFGVRALRDVDRAAFQARSAGLDEVTRRRARHVVSENERVLEAVAAMRRGDAESLGLSLDASHASLRDDFEVSNRSLDAIVAIARRQPACYGARMTGAGFGGCAVALVRAESAAGFSETVAGEYLRDTGLTPGVYISQPGDGAGLVGAA
jgi:galactokinase